MTNTYAIAVTTPMGDIDGSAELTVNGTALTGALKFMGKESPITGGTIDAAGNLVFGGTIATPMGKLAYHVTGTLRNGVIAGFAKTAQGSFAIRSK
jgi:hypothetical protein